MLCETKLGLQLHLMCGHLLGLNSPNVSLFNPNHDLNSFSRCGNSRILLFLSHLPFLFLTCGGLIATAAACKPRLISSFFPLLFGFFHLTQGFVWWAWTVHNPLRNRSMQSVQAFANLSVQSVFKKTPGHEAQQDINNPCFQTIKIRKSLRWNIKWHWVEYSMLVVFW